MIFLELCKKIQQNINRLELKAEEKPVYGFIVFSKLYFFIFFRAFLRIYAFLFVEDPSHFFVFTGVEKDNMYFTQSTYCTYKRFQKKTTGFSKFAFTAVIITSVATSFLLYFLMNIFKPDSSNYPTYAANEVWYDSDWAYRRQIIIDHVKVADSANPSKTYADFPILISVDGLVNVNANGADIRFTSYDGITELPREIESYSSGSLKAWVKIMLTKDSSDVSDDVIYMYYGNVNAVEPDVDSAYGSESVWKTDGVNAGAAIVQHMKDFTISAVNNSAANIKKGIKKAAYEPIESIGKIASGQSFDGVDDYIDNGTGIEKSVDWTIIAWIKPNAWGSGSPVFSADSNASIGTRWGIYLGDDQTFRIYTSDGINQDGAYIMDWNSINYPLDKFTHIGATVKGANKNFYRNGVQVGSNVASIINKGTSYGLSTGRFGENNGSYFNGAIDEVLVFKRSLAAQEIATLYNNQNDPSSFYILGEEEAAVDYLK